MSLGTIHKQPYEELNRSHDFSPDLGAGDTLTLDTVTAKNVKTGADSTAQVIAASPAPAVSGQTVTFRVVAGVDLEDHKITIRVSTSAGEKLEADLDLFVREH